MRFLLLSLAFLTAPFASANTLQFGDIESEKAHGLVAEKSEIITGAKGHPARKILPLVEDGWQGGSMRFRMETDPEKQNYLTIKLWGEELNPNLFFLLCEGRQVGYRHLGDIEILDLGSEALVSKGRFYYRTCPLPLNLTKGKSSVNLEIRATGGIWGYGQDFEKFQRRMKESSRAIYAVMTHSETALPLPVSENPGSLLENAPLTTEPGEEVITLAKERVNHEIARLLEDTKRPCSQMQTLFLARAYRQPWTLAHNDERAVAKILSSLDALHAAWRKDPNLAYEERSTWNPDWFGLGPCGQIIELMKDQLAPFLEAEIDAAEGKKVTRRVGYRDMLIAARDSHRKTRRPYTNQTMIIDLYGIYLPDRGIRVLDPAMALPEEKALRYLYEAIGLEPWLGPEIDGIPTKPLGENYLQLTAKGLTRELGYVGYYGEVLDWVGQIYEATGPAFGEKGDERIRAQLVKIAKARAPFRYPGLDADGNRAMLIETAVGWRDTHFPGGVAYGQRPSWDACPLESAAMTIDPALLGYAHQMFAENQYFASVARMLEVKTFRATFGLLALPGHYEQVRATADPGTRLPMTGDFLFTDEEAGVVALRNGDEIFYASLYWRARLGINFLARVHSITPDGHRVATVYQDVDFTPSGSFHEMKDWTNFGFANGGGHIHYPERIPSAHAGLKLPIPAMPEGSAYEVGREHPLAGRGDFYRLRYGKWLIAMNMSADKEFTLSVPEGAFLNLTSSQPAPGGSEIKIPARTSVVLIEGK